MPASTRAPRRAFAGSTALVCGGSKGIGRATAEHIARRGGRVTLVARDETALAQAAESISAAAGTPVATLALDATDEGAVLAAFGRHFETEGVPDFLVNAVGRAFPHYVADLSLDDFRATMEANYFGQLVPTLVTLPHMVERGHGHVAFTSSVLGYMGLMGYADYAPSKYALFGLAESLRHELGPAGIGFSVLFPPDTDTPGFETENETKPREWFATSAAKLMSADAVGTAFADGIERRRFEITPGQAGWLRKLARLSPRALRLFSDREFAAARRKLERA